MGEAAPAPEVGPRAADLAGDGFTTVVGAAILAAGRVLACRRTHPAEAAGRWEFPGGKVEPGEDAEGALRREIAEELACEVEVVRWLPGEAAIRPGWVLRVALAVLVGGEPTPVTHDRARWLAADEFGGINWLEPDRGFLDSVRAALPGHAPTA